MSPTRAGFRISVFGLICLLFVVLLPRPAEGQGAPSLSIPTEPLAVADGATVLPIQFDANGTSIAAVAFSLDLDPTCLFFDATDADANGRPDALQDLPAGFNVSVQSDPADADGELDIALYDSTPPIASLGSGVLLTIGFVVPPTCNPDNRLETATAVQFSTAPVVSFGTPLGARITGQASGASVPLVFFDAPTDIHLSSNRVPENAPQPAPVGQLHTVDPNAGDSHTYALLPDWGDGAAFAISGNQLRTARRFDFEQRATYTIRVRSRDMTGLTVSRDFVVEVTNVNEAPTAVADEVAPELTVFSGAGAPIDVLANDRDPDVGTRLSILDASRPTTGSVATDGETVIFDPPDAGNGVATFHYTVTDNDATLPLTATAPVTVTYVADDARGDCNGDQLLDTSDVDAAVRELFDVTTGVPWYALYGTGFPGSPQGCDANGDRTIGSSDVVCTARHATGAACDGAVAAGQTAGAVLTMTTQSLPEQVHVAFTLAGTGRDIAAVSFVLHYDPAVLLLDAADADADGVYDAVAFQLPTSARGWMHHEAPGLLHVVAAVVQPPFAALPDGSLIKLHFARRLPDNPIFSFTARSAGDVNGHAAGLDVQSRPPSAAVYLLYLPGLADP